ncbi:rod-binding protein [Azospirillum sp. ST 5-10]|uniref:rod-binding protein n=1 Tax=unclassified Azospirillum TaxID=2630922 RepID=UPI003F49BB21
MDISTVNGRPAARTETALPATGTAEQVARDFEAMVVGQMMETMFAGLDDNTVFGGGDAEKPWRSFMLQEYGKAIAEAGTLGIGDLVREEVARLYAVQGAVQGAAQGEGTP